MVDWEKFGVAGLIILIIFALVLIILWVYVCFIAAGAILTWLGFSGSGFLAVQIVVTVVLLAITGALERFGRKTLT